MDVLLALLGNRQCYQAFNNFADGSDHGSDYAWVYIYNESLTGSPLRQEGTGVVDITGFDGQEDEVVRSLITANHAVGTDTDVYDMHQRLSPI